MEFGEGPVLDDDDGLFIEIDERQSVAVYELDDVLVEEAHFGWDKFDESFEPGSLALAGLWIADDEALEFFLVASIAIVFREIHVYSVEIPFGGVSIECLSPFAVGDDIVERLADTLTSVEEAKFFLDEDFLSNGFLGKLIGDRLRRTGEFTHDEIGTRGMILFPSADGGGVDEMMLPEGLQYPIDRGAMEGGSRDDMRCEDRCMPIDDAVHDTGMFR